MIRITLICLMALLGLVQPAGAQEPDLVLYANIQNLKLFPAGNPLGYPIIMLRSNDQLELHFDDREGGVKAYSYTWQLCNADWTPANLSPMDYIRGFTQQRILTYRSSSVALTRYTHYTQVIPEKNIGPSRSGNYLLKVFLDGDPNKIVFTRRVLVVEEKAGVGMQVQQPFNSQIFQTHQKVVFRVDTRSLNIMNAPQQVTVRILQNYRWDNSKFGLRPTFIRQNSLEYNYEQDCIFSAGKEWRWLDLRSFRLQSDRVDSAQYGNTFTNIYVVPDGDRAASRFVYYRDANGMYYNQTLDGLNPYWQGDYATVRFSYKPPAGQAFKEDVYLFGELTNWGKDPAAKMSFNAARGMYETAIWLKQGYYDYGYALSTGTGEKQVFSMDRTEGNYWETENNYIVLVYYRGIGGRADELVAYGKINSLVGRPQ
ncbi:DUF5103 domain-containing protein [Flavihumibacter petaseus]|uniref:Type 9 secretion system plug protein N-terminal domain-containing protein n=1 Tax=Flavihumibacter petaseus NBRC 106054 TaxID=1220578 RepID=A0A0E9N0V3_9BACT|nr:DUF5103 domain-containing protein [Flavihumibacter petaseus]GAO43464.1 hypothetical protein FPE01S_02_05690 [Flavihumibacter petaseus NBRC 106054]